MLSHVSIKGPPLTWGGEMYWLGVPSFYIGLSRYLRISHNLSNPGEIQDISIRREFHLGDATL